MLKLSPLPVAESVFNLFHVPHTYCRVWIIISAQCVVKGRMNVLEFLIQNPLHHSPHFTQLFPCLSATLDNRSSELGTSSYLSCIPVMSQGPWPVLNPSIPSMKSAKAERWLVVAGSMSSVPLQQAPQAPVPRGKADSV